MSATRLSLAQQIALLEDTAPKDFDPEEFQSAEIPQDEEDLEDNTAAARAHYVDVGPSTLRKLHDSLTDAKYDGKRTSRKQLQERDEEQDSDEAEAEDEAEDESEDDDESEDEDESEKLSQDGHSSVIEDEQASESEARDTPEPSKPSHHSDSDPPEDLSSALRKTRDEDRTKGKAVARQIAIWDTLLDARIRMQKSVTAANRLPTPSDILYFSKSPTGASAVQKLLNEALSLSDEISELQEGLLITNEGIAPPPRKRRRISSPAPLVASICAEDVQAATVSASSLSAAMHPYLLNTLTKWSSKIQAVAPSVLLPSSRGAFSSRGAQGMKSAVALVEETLAASDYGKLLARTQVRRAKGSRVGQLNGHADGENEEIEDTEVFDDTDFYQQLLRDVIDSRSGNGAGAGAEDWVAMQKQKKAKKRVDTKASKGRKLRYEVHEKLQNFMPPVPATHGWHEEQIDELFSSLLGKGFEEINPSTAAAPLTDGLKDTESGLISADVLKGFRVFG